MVWGRKHHALSNNNSASGKDNKFVDLFVYISTYPRYAPISNQTSAHRPTKDRRSHPASISRFGRLLTDGGSGNRIPKTQTECWFSGANLFAHRSQPSVVAR